MKNPRRTALSLVPVVVLALVLAVPGIALGAGTLGGTVSDGVTLLGIPSARVGLYARTATGTALVGGRMTGVVGNYGGIIADDSIAPLYVTRTGRPGYITLEQNVPLPIVGATLYNPVLQPDPVLVERVADNDRYTTAVRVARERFTSPQTPQGWWGVETIIVASGEDRAAADPLAAAGLCAVYGDTPLFLVSSTNVPSSVRRAVSEISATYGRPVRIVVVGGPASVPDARVAEVAAAATYGAIPDRLIATGDRFDLAAAIAERITAVGGPPGIALVANGADSEKFFDALALSTLASAKGFPILLVNENSVPAVTRNALDQLAGSKDIFVGGGPATVSEGVMTQLDQRYGTVERWAGSDRYRTAQVIADKAILRGVVSDDLVGVAAKLPDALTGGATIGQSRGVLLITNGESLTPSTGSWIAGHKAGTDKAYVIGGPVSVTEGVKNQVHDRLQ